MTGAEFNEQPEEPFGFEGDPQAPFGDGSLTPEDAMAAPDEPNGSDARIERLYTSSTY